MKRALIKLCLSMTLSILGLYALSRITGNYYIAFFAIQALMAANNIQERFVNDERYERKDEQSN